MTDEQRDPEPQADGVFGNLPSSRPGSRSPRRDGERRASGRPASTARPAAREPSPGTDAPPPPPPPPPAGQAPAAGGGRIGGVEDLAWAGVRAASRLLEVVRKPRDSG